jgi:ribosome maturation factor RimP
MAARTPQRERLVELLDPVITSAGYDLEDLSVSAAGRRSVVRVVVDRDGGVDLDAIAELSRDVSNVLDDGPAAAVLNGPFVLEVSSPGVDRPLVLPRHWRRAVGRLVSVGTADGPVTGRVIAADEHQLSLLVGGSAEQLPLAALGPGRVQIEFAHAGAPSDGSVADEHADVDDDMCAEEV